MSIQTRWTLHTWDRWGKTVLPTPMSVIFLSLMLVFVLALSVQAGKIVFITGQQHSSQGGNPDLWIMNDDGTGVAPLVEDPAADISPTYSPAANKVAFLSNRSGPWAIYTVDPDGSNLQMTPNSEFNAPDITEDWSRLDWSPDGQKLVYHALDVVGGMGSINVDGTGKTVYTTDGVSGTAYNKVRGVSWGPSMDEVMVHVENYSWNQNIFRYTISTDSWDQMTLDTPSSHAMSADVNLLGEIVFSRRASGDQLYDLYVMDNVPGGPSTNLTNFSPPVGAYNPAWMSDQGAVFDMTGTAISERHIGLIQADGTGFTEFNVPTGKWYAMDPTWIPEPSTLVLLALACPWIAGRRRN